MTIEARKGVVRILSNYTRLLITLGLGILVVPLTIRWLGDDAFGIISLLGANIGLAGIFRQIIQMSLVRELGQAYHGDENAFRQNYATICVIAVIAAVLSVISFGVVFALIPVFKISEEFIWAARWFVVGQGAYTAVTIILAPILNMYLVKERFVGYNIWYIGVRSGNIISVILLGYIIAIDDPAFGLAVHGVVWAFLASLGMVIAAWVMVRKDHRLMFTVKGSDKHARSQVFSTFSWNTVVQIAMNLHEQIPPLLLNLFFGTLVNAAWGIGFRFVSYIRMCTTGVQFGSDAVSARMNSGEDSEDSRRQLQRLVAIQTKMTAMIAFPAAMGVFVFSWPIFDAWVGSSLEEYNTVMPVAVYMSRILAIALLARAISDTWIIILYGAGYVKAYAPWVLAGGIFAPVVSVVLMLVVPGSYVVYMPPVMYAFVLVTIHVGVLPFIVGKCLHTKGPSLILALGKPMLATMIAIGCSLLVLFLGGGIEDLGYQGALTQERGQAIEWVWILSSIVVFGFVYAIASYSFVLESAERRRISTVVLNRITMRSSS